MPNTHERREVLKSRNQRGASLRLDAREARTGETLRHELAIAVYGTLDKLGQREITTVKDGRVVLNFTGRIALYEARHRKAGLKADTMGRATWQPVPMPRDPLAKPVLHPAFAQVSTMFDQMFRPRLAA